MKQNRKLKLTSKLFNLETENIAINEIVVIVIVLITVFGMLLLMYV